MGRKGTSKDSQFVDALVSVGMAELSIAEQTSEQTRRAALRLLANEVCVLCGKTQFYIPMGFADLVVLADWRERVRAFPSRHAHGLAQLALALIEFGQERLAVDLRMPVAAALRTMQRITWRLLEMFERDNLYIPSDDDFAKRERDRQVVRLLGEAGSDGTQKYTHARAQQVARQFGLTYQHVMVIAQTERDAARGAEKEAEHD